MPWHLPRCVISSDAMRPPCLNAAGASPSWAASMAWLRYKAVGTITRGWALAHMGQANEGLAEQLKGLEEYGETRVQAWLVYFKAMLAEVYHCVGDAESGLAAVADALALSDHLGERFWQAGMLHRKGAMLDSLGKDHHDEAEYCYRESLAISTEQQARSIALRAATSLARIWHHEGRDAEAGDLLRPLHGMFTEGLDTPDLLEARALLGELR